MPTLEINGRRVEVGEEFMQLSPEDQQRTVNEIAAKLEPPKAEYRGGFSPTFDAMTEGSQAGLMFGFDDEIGAAMLAPIHAGISAVKGNGFDIGKEYTRLQQELDARKKARREAHSIASIAGEVAGGLAGGGSLAAKGVTLAGRAATGTGKVLAAAGEGAAYGGAYGAGEAKPGERLAGVGKGAAIGAITGGVLQAGGNAVSNALSRRAASRMAPATDDLATATNTLYQQSRDAGVNIKAKALNKLKTGMKMAAGRINATLRPKTAGVVDDIDDLLSRDMSLEQFDELRQAIGQAMKRAEPQDVRTLRLMKQQIDNFADNIRPQDITGDMRGFDFIKQARVLNARKAKTEIIERILDNADRKGTGQYTQSGLANAVRREMETLYKQIQNGKHKGFSKEEIDLIRQMAKGESSSIVMRLLAKFDPKGVVSIMGGQVAGSFLPGAGNIMVPLAGHAAGRAVDKAALNAALGLRNATASGTAPLMLEGTKKVAPFIGGSVAASTAIPRSLPR